MEIATEELPGGITRVILVGRLDIAGAAAVDQRMNEIAAAHRVVLVDLQQVSFIGSMGLSALVAPARTIKSRGGRLVLVGPNQMVGEVLKSTLVDTFIPVFSNLEAAIAAMQ